MNSRTIYLENINEAVNEITDILGKEIVLKSGGEEYIPSRGQRYTWQHCIVANTEYYIKNIQENINLLSSQSLNFIYFNLVEIKNKLNTALFYLNECEEHNQEKVSSVLEDTQQFIDHNNSLNNLSYEFNDSISAQDIDYLYNKLNNELKNFDANYVIHNYITDEVIKDRDTRNDILSKLVEINNLLLKPKDYATGRHIERIISQIENMILNNRQIEENIKEVKEIAQQVSEIEKQFKKNSSIEVNYKLLNGYSIETKNLLNKIESIHKIIILIFIGIISILTFKFILIIFLNDFFKDWFNFFSFITLILTLSALLTYFIKERSRLIKLYDYYNLSKLELSALPDYMNELDRQQRNDLYISLAPNYFRGINYQKENITNNIKEENENSIKLLNDIFKLLKEIKSIK
ncbi:hypothetical protein ACLBWM_05750 [Acinetobacter radioresistens]